MRCRSSASAIMRSEWRLIWSFETSQRPVVDEYVAAQHDSLVSNGARLDFTVRLPFNRVELNAQEALSAVQHFAVIVG